MGSMGSVIELVDKQFINCVKRIWNESRRGGRRHSFNKGVRVSNTNTTNIQVQSCNISSFIGHFCGVNSELLVAYLGVY